MTKAIWGGIALGFIFLMAACVSPLELDRAVESRLNISGIITNGSTQRTITIARTDQFRTNVADVSATGKLFEDGQLLAELEAPEPGRLLVPQSVTFEQGAVYFFEITADGQVFRTLPQALPAPAPSHSLTWREGTEVFLNSRGVPVEREAVEILADFDVEPSQPNQFFRYQMESAYELREIPREQVDTTVIIDSTFVLGEGWRVEITKEFTPDTAKICYLSRPVNTYPSVLVATAPLAAGPARQKMMSQPIDGSFAWKQVFSVYRHQITQEAYQYYERLERLSNLDGSLYDEIPAAVRGNLFDVADSTAIVLGYIELSIADTMRLSLDGSTLGRFIRDGCRPPPGDPLECPPAIPNPSTGEIPPCKCFDCDLVFGRDKTIKPFYWDE